MKKLVKVLSFIMLFAVAFTLVACAPKDASAAKEKLEKKDYTVAVDGTIIPAALKLVGVKDIETVITASKTVEKKDERQTESVTAIKFASKGAAKDALDAVKSYAEKNATETEVKQAGAWLYYGTKQGAKDFK